MNVEPILAILREIPGLAGLYLFGSQAQGGSGPASDVDLAFLAARPLPPKAKSDLAGRIAAKVGTDVDLIDLRAASTILQMEIMRHGRLIEAANPTALAVFELRILRDYEDLRIRRRGIEADIALRGRVYA